MSEVKFLRDQIETTFKGDSWHGPNLMKTLKGIDHKQAKKRIIDDRHTIWELTDHTSFWMEEVCKSIKDHAQMKPDMENNWPKMGSSEEDWQRSVKRLETSVNMVLEALLDWKEEDLHTLVPGETYTFKQMLHGVVHHNLYHAGQINLLKRKTG